MTQWSERTARAAFASHRLVGWIYWDPIGISSYAALGVPGGTGYYVATRGAPLAAAGNDAVTAAFYSIHPGFVAGALDLCRGATTFEAAAAARDDAVVRGLRTYVPEICDDLGAMAAPLWAAADALTPAGRVLFAAHRDWPRPDDDLLSAWLAVNCIREWRGDTHWAVLIAEEIDEATAGVLDGAWRGYPGDWLPKSRGAQDDAIERAFAWLADRGMADGHDVTAEGIAYRQSLEDRIDRLCLPAWEHLGVEATTRFLDLVEPVGDRLVARIDETAGPNWMPAARTRPSQGTP
jgi:hypothetical protein